MFFWISIWILKLLEVPKISVNHIKTVLHLFELRNIYVHYKWKANNDDDNKHRNDLKNTVFLAYNAIKYFHMYENKHIYYKSKGILKKCLNKA